MCALVTNESVVSEFNNALRIYNDHHLISYVTLKWKINMPQHFQCLHQTLKIYSLQW